MFQWSAGEKLRNDGLSVRVARSGCKQITQTCAFVQFVQSARFDVCCVVRLRLQQQLTPLQLARQPTHRNQDGLAEVSPREAAGRIQKQMADPQAVRLFLVGTQT
mmetsp:Transcript_109510/g.171253  ORF Transcript_109510/g.171253 Transcript_109510/m.171253 type:complete len:105 (+) Transcript_109510:328-642(+)